jgi:hypothetical protein
MIGYFKIIDNLNLLAVAFWAFGLLIFNRAPPLPKQVYWEFLHGFTGFGGVTMRSSPQPGSVERPQENAAPRANGPCRNATASAAITNPTSSPQTKLFILHL